MINYYGQENEKPGITGVCNNLNIQMIMLVSYFVLVKFLAILVLFWLELQLDGC